MLARFYPRPRLHARLRKMLTRRTWNAILVRAGRRGHARRAHWTRAENATLMLEWQCVTVRTLRAKLNGRTWVGIYQHATEIGLRAGIPQGRIGVQDAADAIGVHYSTLGKILAWAGIVAHYAYPGPDSTAIHGRRMHVDWQATHDAALAWLRLESIADGARRYGLTFSTFRRWVENDRAVRETAYRVLMWCREFRRPSARAIGRCARSPRRFAVPRNRPVAYQLSDRTGYAESSEIVFATSVREARRRGYLDDVDYIDLAAERAPSMDVFARYPFALTLRAKLLHGWWQECGSCGTHVKLGAGWIADRGVIVTEDSAYCDADCEAKAEGARRGLHFRYELEALHVEREVTRRWPEAVPCGRASFFRAPHDAPRPEDGFRASVRLRFPARGLWATWVEGDADLSQLSFDALAKPAVTESDARTEEWTRKQRAAKRKMVRR